MKPIATFLLSALAAVSSASTACFVPGEVSEYKVSWMGLPLAWVKTTTDVVEENGNELIRIEQRAQSYAAYNHIYKVDNAMVVLVDPETTLPVRLDVIQNEGSRHASHLTHFDHANQTATFIDRNSNTTNEVAIKPDTQDILTFLYSGRANTLLELANTIPELYVNGKLYELGMELRKEGRIKLPDYGKVESTQVEPIAEFDGLFLRQGKIFFWVSKQNPRMVTLIQAKVPVGKISIKLQNVDGLGGNWAKKEE